MTVGLESITVTRWIVATLTTDPTLAGMLGGPQTAALRVVEGVLDDDQPTAAPDGTALPWITFTIPPTADLKVVGQIQVATAVEFQLRATVLGSSYTPLIPTYARAHALLESKANIAVADGLILTCARESGIQFPERTNGTEYRHIGGLYRAWAQ